jgi:hypothetical protein
MSSMTRHVFVVVRHSWSYDDQWWTGDDRPVKAFSDRQQAEAYLARCEADWAEWQEANWGAQTETRFTILEMDVTA